MDTDDNEVRRFAHSEETAAQPATTPVPDATTVLVCGELVVVRQRDGTAALCGVYVTFGKCAIFSTHDLFPGDGFLFAK